jgi:DNA modification methylase
MDYQTFLATKRQTVAASGFEADAAAINPKLFKFQAAIVLWALRLGKAAVFSERGTGKTAIELSWASHVAAYTDKPVLILTPLAVAHQHVREGLKFGVNVKHVKEQSEVGGTGVYVTNYERLHLFDTDAFAGVVLDESSILKNFTGKTKRTILRRFKNTPYKLAASATPAPNDHLELGNHADFLDVMPSNEMISRWFINDSMSAGNYRLKKHAKKDFWRWLTSWAVCISHPRDLGDDYDMPGFDLPKLELVEHRLSAPQASIERAWSEGKLLPDDSPSSTKMHKVKRESLAARVAKAVEIVASVPANEPIAIWCDTDYEANALIKAFPEAVEVRGSQKDTVKEERLTAFSEGRARLIITKADIAGHGLNWQHCANTVFVGVSYSFEKFYQAIGRFHRFGQTKPVNAHVIYSETEGNIIVTLDQKREAFKDMQAQMNEAMREHGLIRNDARRELKAAQFEVAQGKDWTLYLGDCVPVTASLPDDSIDFSVYSPPFANLYIYGDSEADMGNSADDAEFFQHYEYLINELYRVTRPGRLTAVHCKDLPTYINRDGAAGLRDFPGEIIRAHEAHGWQYHSRVTIWKDPVIEMQRTKNHGLLHKNFTDRAEACRQGMPDYLLLFRKWPIDGGVEIKQRREFGDYIGTNPPTIAEIASRQRSERENYSIAVWQRYASPVWFDIDQTNVLNYQIAKSNEDEKHIAPLQLDVIERAIDLWSMPGEVVFSPFAGIGSEPYTAVKLGRKATGVELKREYFNIAVANLKEAEMLANQPTLFDWAETQKAVSE